MTQRTDRFFKCRSSQHPSAALRTVLQTPAEAMFSVHGLATLTAAAVYPASGEEGLGGWRVFSMRRAALFSKAGHWGRHRLHLAPESGGRRGLRDGGAALLSPASQADGTLLQGGGQRNGHGREETWPCVALWRGRSDKARPFLTALAPLKAVERPSAFARSAVRRAPERHLDFP